MLHNKRNNYNEKPMHHNEEKAPLSAAKESPHKAAKTQHSQKINKLVIIIIKQTNVCYNLGMKNFLSFSFKKKKEMLFHSPSDRK